MSSTSHQAINDEEQAGLDQIAEVPGTPGKDYTVWYERQ